MKKKLLCSLMCISILLFTVGCGADNTDDYSTDNNYSYDESDESSESYESYDDYDSDDSYNSYDSYNTYDNTEAYGYDSNDPYAAAHDYDGDGDITEEEFSDALSDAFEDYSYMFE